MTAESGRRVLVAGVGNIFLGDDGFGVEVVNRLGQSALPGVDVADYGIRGVHLAYDLLEGDYDTLVLVDSLPVRDRPGTLTVLDASPEHVPAASAVGEAGAVAGGTARGGAALDGPSPSVDGHSMSPATVLAILRQLGGLVERVLVVGCQPATVAEGVGLSEPVRAAVDDAARLVDEVVRAEVARPVAGDGADPTRAG